MESIIFVIFLLAFCGIGIYVAIVVINNQKKAGRGREKSQELSGYKEILSFYTKIVGVSYGNAQSIIPYLKCGDALTFVREPNNKYDRNAILVKYGRNKLGHLSADIAEDIAPHMDKGCIVTGKVENVTGGSNGKSYGCNIEVCVLALPEYIKSSDETKQVNKQEKICVDDDVDVSNPFYSKKCVFYLTHNTDKNKYINMALRLGATSTYYVSSRTDYFIIDDENSVDCNNSAQIIKYKQALERNPNVKLLLLDEFIEITKRYLPDVHI